MNSVFDTSVTAASRISSKYITLYAIDDPGWISQWCLVLDPRLGIGFMQGHRVQAASGVRQFSAS